MVNKYHMVFLYMHVSGVSELNVCGGSPARCLGKFEVCLTSKKVAVSLSLNSYCV
jgi:hypothetical protein